MPRSRYSKFVKATKGFTSEDEEPESDSTFPSGPESRSTTSDESSQRYSTSRLESKKRYEDTCESDAEVPSGSEALFTTSDKPLKIPLPSRSSQIRTGFSSSPSSTGTKKKAGNINPRVKGGRMRPSPRHAEARRRDVTEVSDDTLSNVRESTTTETLETETKSSAKDSKSKSKKHTKNPSRQPIPTAGASISDPRSRHSSTSSLNLSTGSHHDDSNISEYSSHETSADGGI